MRVAQLILLLLVPELVTPDLSHAYIDPSTGSMVFQFAAGVILGSLLTVGRWWTSAGNTAKLGWCKVRRR